MDIMLSYKKLFLRHISRQIEPLFRPECWYYRSEVVDNSPFNNALTKNCTILPSSVRHLRGFLLAFAIFHLLREVELCKICRNRIIV